MKKHNTNKKQMKMRYLTTSAFLVGGAILTSQSVFGQTYAGPPSNYNDLIFGFQNQAGSGTVDYAINLGQASSIVGKSTVVDLSSDFSISDFDSVLGGSSSMYGGVIGAASSGVNANTADVYVTQSRGGAGNPAVPGSSVSQTMSKAQDNTTYSAISTLVTPAAGTGVLDTTKTWESLIDPATTVWQQDTGLDPDSVVAPSSVVYEDLWETSASTTGFKTFNYLGYFTLDLTGANPKLTFTGLNVPASLSAPKIASVSITGGVATVVSSSAFSGHSYQLQYTTSLNAPVSWVNVGSSVTASGTTVTNTDTTATGGKRFYRVQGQ